MGIPQIFIFINAPGMQKSSASVMHGGADTFQHNSMRKREAQMKLTVKAAAIAFLAAGLVVSYAQTSGSTPPAKKHAAARKPAAPAGPTVQEQIDQMKQQFQGEIDGLKADLATKDEQLKQAQQTAADAQAAAAKAEADATAQQQSATENAAAVSTLQSTVTDLKADSLSLATTVSDETTASRSRSRVPMRSTSREWPSRSRAASSRLKPWTAPRPPPATSTRRLPAFRCRTPTPASERVLRHGSSVAPGLQGERQAPQRGPHRPTTRWTGWAPALPRTTTSRTATSCASAKSGLMPRQRAAGISRAARVGRWSRKPRRA